VKVVPEKEPADPVIVVPLRVTIAVSYFAVSVELAAKPKPEMETVEPGLQLVVFVEIDGVTLNVAEAELYWLSVATIV